MNDMSWESSDGNMKNSTESTAKDEIDEEMKNKDTIDEEMKRQNQFNELTAKDTPSTNTDAKFMRTIQSAIKDRENEDRHGINEGRNMLKKKRRKKHKGKFIICKMRIQKNERI